MVKITNIKSDPIYENQPINITWDCVDTNPADELLGLNDIVVGYEILATIIEKPNSVNDMTKFKQYIMPENDPNNHTKHFTITNFYDLVSDSYNSVPLHEGHLILIKIRSLNINSKLDSEFSLYQSFIEFTPRVFLDNLPNQQRFIPVKETQTRYQVTKSFSFNSNEDLLYSKGYEDTKQLYSTKGNEITDSIQTYLYWNYNDNSNQYSKPVIKTFYKEGTKILYPPKEVFITDLDSGKDLLEHEFLIEFQDNMLNFMAEDGQIIENDFTTEVYCGCDFEPNKKKYSNKILISSAKDSVHSFKIILPVKNLANTDFINNLFFVFNPVNNDITWGCQDTYRVDLAPINIKEKELTVVENNADNLISVIEYNENLILDKLNINKVPKKVLRILLNKIPTAIESITIKDINLENSTSTELTTTRSFYTSGRIILVPLEDWMVTGEDGEKFNVLININLNEVITLETTYQKPIVFYGFYNKEAQGKQIESHIINNNPFTVMNIIDDNEKITLSRPITNQNITGGKIFFTSQPDQLEETPSSDKKSPKTLFSPGEFQPTKKTAYYFWYEIEDKEGNIKESEKHIEIFVQNKTDIPVSTNVNTINVIKEKYYSNGKGRAAHIPLINEDKVNPIIGVHLNFVAENAKNNFDCYFSNFTTNPIFKIPDLSFICPSSGLPYKVKIQLIYQSATMPGGTTIDPIEKKVTIVNFPILKSLEWINTNNYFVKNTLHLPATNSTVSKTKLKLDKIQESTTLENGLYLVVEQRIKTGEIITWKTENLDIKNQEFEVAKETELIKCYLRDEEMVGDPIYYFCVNDPMMNTEINLSTDLTYKKYSAGINIGTNYRLIKDWVKGLIFKYQCDSKHQVNLNYTYKFINTDEYPVDNKPAVLETTEQPSDNSKISENTESITKILPSSETYYYPGNKTIEDFDILGGITKLNGLSCVDYYIDVSLDVEIKSRVGEVVKGETIKFQISPRPKFKEFKKIFVDEVDSCKLQGYSFLFSYSDEANFDETSQQYIDLKVLRNTLNDEMQIYTIKKEVITNSDLIPESLKVSIKFDKLIQINSKTTFAIELNVPHTNSIFAYSILRDGTIIKSLDQAKITNLETETGISSLSVKPYTVDKEVAFTCEIPIESTNEEDFYYEYGFRKPPQGPNQENVVPDYITGWVSFVLPNTPLIKKRINISSFSLDFTNHKILAKIKQANLFNFSWPESSTNIGDWLVDIDLFKQLKYNFVFKFTNRFNETMTTSSYQGLYNFYEKISCDKSIMLQHKASDANTEEAPYILYDSANFIQEGNKLKVSTKIEYYTGEKIILRLFDGNKEVKNTIISLPGSTNGEILNTSPEIIYDMPEIEEPDDKNWSLQISTKRQNLDQLILDTGKIVTQVIAHKPCDISILRYIVDPESSENNTKINLNLQAETKWNTELQNLSGIQWLGYQYKKSDVSDLIKVTTRYEVKLDDVKLGTLNEIDITNFNTTNLFKTDSQFIITTDGNNDKQTAQLYIQAFITVNQQLGTDDKKNNNEITKVSKKIPIVFSFLRPTVVYKRNQLGINVRENRLDSEEATALFVSSYGGKSIIKLVSKDGSKVVFIDLETGSILNSLDMAIPKKIDMVNGAIENFDLRNCKFNNIGINDMIIDGGHWTSP